MSNHTDAILANLQRVADREPLVLPAPPLRCVAWVMPHHRPMRRLVIEADTLPLARQAIAAAARVSYPTGGFSFTVRPET